MDGAVVPESPGCVADGAADPAGDVADGAVEPAVDVAVPPDCGGGACQMVCVSRNERNGENH
ncbi:hypothetical protein, partial [Kocuria marina]|uniref:hypothetical protein n=1 Tax=Kocuria marina TaxID=223184 RepID=UPI0022E28C7D